MRLRQTFQPKLHAEASQESRRRLILSHMPNQEGPTMPVPRPIDPLTNLRLFLFRTKQNLKRKENSQFSRHDNLVLEQPPFQFDPVQAKKENRIKFQAFLDGELQASEYLTLKNYQRLYSITKDENESESQDDRQGKESTLKRLKEKILFRYRREMRRRKSTTSQSMSSDPVVQAAEKLKALIVKKAVQGRQEFSGQAMEKCMKQVKMIREAERAVEEIKGKLQCGSGCGLKTARSATKDIKILRSEVKPEPREREMSRLELTKSITEEADRIFVKEQRPMSKKLLQNNYALLSQNKFEKVVKHIHFESRKEKEAQKECLTHRSTMSNKTVRLRKVKQIHYQSTLEDRDDSCNSSLNSIYERKIDDLYNMQHQMQRQIQANSCESLIKRIKQIQNYQRLNEEIMTTNNNKLHKPIHC